ncbi:hypothetical protein D9V37_08340 [Nocardioides mangrovicus]|uniref:GP-PDE domain-containing protein n=1 Tax=Nocardioides mangrovicus TaxID=2478913 RepID=A0A3L8P484_9ACTN|nr:glycerophosphodiester phosphodiesterase family protein [Nocardioides mangrovicus]RLV49884.1 hypothetical protein D9V37_08340 [Nocardioides mangrovicus]
MLVAAIALAAAAAAGPDRSLAGCGGVPVVAHRGVHSVHTTEDSAASFLRAVQKGADVVEGDARLSADGTWVLMHDPTVNRTTNGRGRVSRLHDATLARLRYTDGRVGVSTLDASLTPLDAAPAQLQIEIKPASPGRGALQRFMAVLDAHGLRARATITSFHPAVLARLRRLDPGWQTAPILTHAPRHAASMRRYGGSVDLAAHAVTWRAVRALHRAGVTVQTWTVDSHPTWRRVVRNGVDGVITDQVSRSQRWCRSVG